MNGKKTLEKSANAALRSLNKTIKKVFGFDNLAQVHYEINAIEVLFETMFNIHKESINSETINNWKGNCAQTKSKMRELWAKYVTLQYFASIGVEHVGYKNIVLNKIPEGVSWKSKN